MSNTIKEWPCDERPRELLLKKGAEFLSDTQLLAIIFGSGTRDMDVLSFSRGLLRRYGGLANLSRSNSFTLLKEKGLGPAKVSALLAAVELSKRVSRGSLIKEKSFSSSGQVAKFYLPHYSYQRYESFWVVFLNNQNKFIADKELFRGTIDRAAVYPREVVRSAIEHDATRIIALHNHPSGSLKPSSQDIKLTKDLDKALELLDITLLDHIIIAGDSYYSFADSNML